MLKPWEQLGLLAITLLAMFFTAKVLEKDQLKLPANAQGSSARWCGRSPHARGAWVAPMAPPHAWE